MASSETPQAALSSLSPLTVSLLNPLDAAMWQAWLADHPDTRRRFETLVYRRGHDHCAFWLGAISSTGHGKFRAGSRARAGAAPPGHMRMPGVV